jgi:hypothetical protein
MLQSHGWMWFLWWWHGKASSSVTVLAEVAEQDQNTPAKKIHVAKGQAPPPQPTFGHMVVVCRPVVQKLLPTHPMHLIASLV